MILVTGGAGFIGLNFIREWLSLYDEPVINIDDLRYSANANLLPASPNHIFIKEDIVLPNIQNILIKYQPRALIHFAAESHVDKSIENPWLFMKTNIEGTLNLLSCVKNYLPNCVFLHVSTDEVYGSLKLSDPPFTEQSPYAPNSPYSASKAASDHLVRSFYKTYGMKTLITHCSNNYGRFQYPEKLIPLVITNALAGKDLPIYGDGKNIRDWIHVSDHCAALRLILEKGQYGEIYNIGADCEVSNIELVLKICEFLDEMASKSNSYKNQIRFVTDRLGHDFRYSIDSTKVQKLGWQSKIPLNHGLQELIRSYI
jgi:dTDP-glucose 4,6-dehydratase